MNARIRTHGDLRVWARSFALAMEIFHLAKEFPKHERYSLTDQVLRSSRSVTANLAEAWQKRRYRAAFIAKLSDAETEAAETQVWLQFAAACGYLSANEATRLQAAYDEIIATLVGMITHPEKWTPNK